MNDTWIDYAANANYAMLDAILEMRRAYSTAGEENPIAAILLERLLKETNEISGQIEQLIKAAS